MPDNYYCIEIYTPESRKERRDLVRLLIDYKKKIVRKSRGWGIEDNYRKLYYLCLNMPPIKKGWFRTISPTCEDVRKIIHSYGPLEIKSIEFVGSKTNTVAMQSTRSQKIATQKLFDKNQGL